MKDTDNGAFRWKHIKGIFPAGGCDYIVENCNHEMKLFTNIVDFKLPKVAIQVLKGLVKPHRVSCTIQWYNEGDYMERHIDNENKKHRVQSCSILLTDGFEGGDLIIDGEIAHMEKGDAIIFNPSQPHEVTKVTKGTRVALAVWGIDK